MKKARNALILALCAVLLVGASIAGTLAYLTSNKTVTNTFTVGKVEIDLKESKVNEYGEKVANAESVTGNTYKLIPGHTYVKDPTITVGSDSEECWLFVKVENGLGDHATINWKTTASGDEGTWLQVSGQTEYWVYSKTAKANDEIQVFPSFKYDSGMKDTDITTDASKNITVTAYAIQKDGFDDAAAAWSALNTQLGLTNTNTD